MSCAPAFVVAADVTDRLIAPEGPSEQQLQQLLGDAWTRLRMRGRGLVIDSRLASEAITEDEVTLVLVDMVQSVARNPTGMRSGSETTGPFSRSWTLGDVTSASGRLVVTDEHLADLGLESATACTVVAPFVPAWVC